MKKTKEYPFILSAGLHIDENANTNMRDPAWNNGRRSCTVIMHTDDAKEHSLNDGQPVRVVTEAGEEKIELKVSRLTCVGYIMIPHGFGLIYNGVKHGVNVNHITKNTHRDKIAATPIHRYLPCRVEAV